MKTSFQNEFISFIDSIKPNQKIKVVGHRVPDVDTYISSILVADLFQFLGINAEPVILWDYEDIDTITKSVIEKLCCKKLQKTEIMPDDYFILVDHNNPYESVSQVDTDRILAIIDHHLDEGTECPFKMIERAGSTTKLIYNIYKELNMLSVLDKKKVLYSLMVDTSALMNKKTTQDDIDFANILAKELHINMEHLIEDTFFESNLDLPVSEILKNGFKGFDINGHKVGTAYIEYYKIKEKAEKMIDLFQEEGNKLNYDLFVFIMYDYKEKKTRLLTFGKLKDLLTVTTYNHISSRALEVMPYIREKLNIQ